MNRGKERRFRKKGMKKQWVKGRRKEKKEGKRTMKRGRKN